MDTKKIRRFLESHAYSIPATKDADEMLAALDDVEAEVKAANDRAQDMANLMMDQTTRLRDTFAAAALTGLMANMSDTYHLTINGVPMAPTAAMWVIAESALEERKKFDDAMLKAREGK